MAVVAPAGLEEYVRRIPTLSALSVVAFSFAFAGCRSDARTGPDGMTADLERDLQMASTVRAPRTQAVSAVELIANGGPSGIDRGERSLVRTPRLAPLASNATTEQEVASPNNAAEDPTPTFTPTMTESAPAPAPAPVDEPTAAAGDLGVFVGTSQGTYGTSDQGTRGRGDEGRGRGTGVIIRGGAAGDDHCEPRGGRRGGMGGGAGGIGGNIGTIGTVIGIMGGGGGRRTPFPRY